MTNRKNNAIIVSNDTFSEDDFIEKEIKLTKKLLCLLSNVFLFYGIDPDGINQLLSSVSLTKNVYKAEETIFTPNEFENGVGFVLSGECIVERGKTDGAPIPLNKLSVGASFGILSVFACEDKFPTSVRAKKQTEILFISKKDVLNLINADGRIALNVINFMSNRISFLNQKISMFSADKIEQKLAIHIICQSIESGSDSFLFNLKRTAEAINAGRASLYRAIAVLSEKGVIKLENKKIYILDREGLERI